jgi:CBS domain-containing protein
VTLSTDSKPRLAKTTIGDAMHPGVFSCPPETPLRDVARMMARFRIHAVVVLTEESEADEGIGLWGVVSDIDLIRATAVGDVADRSAGGTAHTPLVTVYPDEPLRRAAELMNDAGVTHLVVVSPGSEWPIGVISTMDVARAIAAEHAPTPELTVT